MFVRLPYQKKKSKLELMQDNEWIERHNQWDKNLAQATHSFHFIHKQAYKFLSWRSLARSGRTMHKIGQRLF